MSETTGLWEHSLRHYLARTASSQPTPGSGPAAALTIATGLALVVKALHVSGSTAAPLADSENLLTRLARFADEDAEAFGDYLQARRDDGCTPAMLEGASRRSCAIPLAIGHAGVEALGLALSAWPQTRRMLLADVHAGGLLIHAGLSAALLGVDADLPALDEAEERKRASQARVRLQEEADTRLARLREQAQRD